MGTISPTTLGTDNACDWLLTTLLTGADDATAMGQVVRSAIRMERKEEEEYVATQEEVDEIVRDHIRLLAEALEKGNLSKKRYESEVRQIQSMTVDSWMAEVMAVDESDDVLDIALAACELLAAQICKPTTTFEEFLDSFPQRKRAKMVKRLRTLQAQAINDELVEEVRSVIELAQKELPDFIEPEQECIEIWRSSLAELTEKLFGYNYQH